MTRGVVPAGRRCVATALLVSAAACGRQPATASEAVVQFYTMLDAAGIHRVPDGPQLLALRPLLTDSLAASLDAARSARERAEKTTSDEKPPFADGDVFTSLFEGATASVVQDSIARGDTTLVVVKFTNASQKPPVDWKDTVVVVRQGGAFRIADVRYGSNWEFGLHGRLLESLRAP